MIIDQLRLANFGIFEGEQALTLTPLSSKRPIVLIGGMNGCGKTTLLNAGPALSNGMSSVAGRSACPSPTLLRLGILINRWRAALK